MSLKAIDLKKWIEKNKSYFVPPICNKMMHNNQLKVFLVGGPNQRKDYHIEEGEELFYMIKGDMCLKVVEKGKHKDVVIKEGQVFLLPAKIPHSPQRFDNTIGLVVERERLKSERDALRYFIDGTTDILYERWFYCKDLGTELVPIIESYHSSQEYKTGKQSKNSKLITAPYCDDCCQQLITPFGLHEWIEANKTEITQKGFKSLFSHEFQSRITVFGGNKTHPLSCDFELFLLQIKNASKIEINSNTEDLKESQTLLIDKNISCLLKTVIESYTLVVSMPVPSHR